MTRLPKPISLLGVSVHPITRVTLLNTLSRWATESERRRVYNVNAHALNLASEQQDFERSLNGADLVFCDGFGAKWAARLLGQELPDRMSLPDWIDDFLRLLPPDHPVFLLGDTRDVIAAAAETMRERHPQLMVNGVHDGFFAVDGEENRAIVDTINDSGAKVLLVGMGMPRQELWIDDNLEDLKVSLAFTVGAMFRYYCGAERRAPMWMTDRGLEWLYRLVRHPRRLFSRYVIGNLRFLFRVMAASLARSRS